jgi:cystathionine beta-lyase/cystathionine gamma-synthase
MQDETRAIHAGPEPDPTWHGVVPPIHLSSTFGFDSDGNRGQYAYTRIGNPTRGMLEANLAALECGSATTATASGMAAVTTAMFLFKAGDHIIVGQDIYGGTYRLFNTLLTKMGLKFSFIDMRSPQALNNAIRSQTRAVWIETPSNPLLNIVDIAAVSTIACEHSLLTLVDNTFMTPYFQKPFALGADLVIHSTSKYLNGHSDVIGGAVVARDTELGLRVRQNAEILGTSQSPFDAYLVLRGIKTLGARMKMHEQSATVIAQFLENHPRVRRVYFPGLDSHPQRDLIKRQMNGNGGMVSFDIDVAADGVPVFLRSLRLFKLAMSLGGVESLIEQPWTMSHATMDEQGLAESGISPQTIRVSVGLEAISDLVEDLDRGLAELDG